MDSERRIGYCEDDIRTLQNHVVEIKQRLRYFDEIISEMKRNIREIGENKKNIHFGGPCEE
jgi:hypothetical protein